MAEQSDPKKPEKPDSGGSLIGDILSDCWKTILKPRGTEIITNAAVDSLYGVADFLSNAVQRWIWKDNVPTTRQVPSRGSRPNQTNYSNRYNQVNGQNTQPQHPQNIGMRSSQKLEYIVLRDRQTADKLVNYMVNAIEKYGYVTVASYYEKYNELLDESNTDPNNPPKLIKPIYQDFNFGWTRVGDIHYIQNRDGLTFNLPTPEPVPKK